MKFLLIGTSPKYIYNMRLNLLTEVTKHGFEVSVMGDKSNVNFEDKIKNKGLPYHRYSVKNSGLNPIHDLSTLAQIIRNINRIGPDVILVYAIKPVIWTGIAANFYKKPRFYALIAGLGYAFQENSKRKLITKVAEILYKISLRKASAVIFQNNENMNNFISRGIVSQKKCFRVYGSGVDLNDYPQIKMPNNENIHFLVVARLLGDKGFRELVLAASEVKKLYPNTVFQWLGPFDHSPDGICKLELERAVSEGLIDYLGESNDVSSFMAKCDVFVLPSYHEGVPRTVLEAMSTGRPILSTDIPGTRDTVINGINGFLVPPKNSKALTERLIWFIKNKDALNEFGENSRKIAERKFDVNIINSEMLKIMNISKAKLKDIE